MATLMKGGDRQHLCRRHDALPAAAMDAYLKHGFLSDWSLYLSQLRHRA